MNLNQKERYIVKLYKEKFENNTFDEFDVCFFVMFLRSHIDKNKFPYIFDWGDSIAHRERNKGKAYSSLKNVQDNKYETKHNSNKLSGYDGIEEKPWKKEWSELGKDLDINFSPKTIDELLLCYISSLQFSQLKNLGEMKIVLTKKDLGLATVSNLEDKRYSFFAVLKNIKPKIDIITPVTINAVTAIRKDNELQLIDEKGNILL